MCFLLPTAIYYFVDLPIAPYCQDFWEKNLESVLPIFVVH